MSALVCGKRPHNFEDHPTSPPIPKRIRRSSLSPIRFSPSSSSSPRSDLVNSALDHLRFVFPGMDTELLERTFRECGDDLEAAIRSLNELRLESVEGNIDSAQDNTQSIPKSTAGIESNTQNNGSSEGTSAPANLPKNGAEWVDLFVREMTSAANMNDARARATRVLEVLEKSIQTQIVVETAQNIQKEYMALKEQLEGLIRDNSILKRAVNLQHERQKEFEERNHELQHLKQMVTQYQEQLRTLEVNNYALNMHLKQAQQSNSSIPGRFHPDIF
ncbi:hypothetical protein GIB67_014962 [Kingdonia uniflora]|uniref:CUE domain-containing protein n=1 Tax=Kingdonia uniflora TaxID=39325 RepID=A0A7J7MU03_9MAGN|nr:hypothetical protein GIB67_014962 [Kingdonia uniflora]